MHIIQWIVTAVILSLAALAVSTAILFTMNARDAVGTFLAFCHAMGAPGYILLALTAAIPALSGCCAYEMWKVRNPFEAFQFKSYLRYLTGYLAVGIMIGIFIDPLLASTFSFWYRLVSSLDWTASILVKAESGLAIFSATYLFYKQGKKRGLLPNFILRNLITG